MKEKQFYLKLTVIFLLTMNKFGDCWRGSRRAPVENDFKNGFYMVVGNEKVNPNSKYVVSALAQNTKEPVEIDFKLHDKDESKDIPVQTQKVKLDPSKSQLIEFDIKNFEKPNLVLDINATFGGKNYSNSMNLRYNNKFVFIFIQTDKALYKPGEKVNIRVVLTDSNLVPISDDNKINVFITDPMKNRIKQWLNSNISDGIFTGSFQLNEEQKLGDYTINVDTQTTQKKTKSFEVNEYVLPQFDVKIVAPKYVTYDDPKFTATIDARYTHGKPINGLLKLTMKQRYFYPNREHRFWPETKSLEKIEIEKPINGNVDVELNPVQQLALTSTRDYDLEIELVAVVTENLTKKNFTQTSYISLAENNVRIEVLNSNEQLKPGLPIEIKIKVVKREDEPVIDNVNKVKLGYSFNLKDKTDENYIEQEYAIQNGLIIEGLKIDVPKNATDLYIRAKYKDHKYSVHQFQATNSKSGHFIQLNVLNKKNQKNIFKTGEKVDLELRSTSPISYYTLMIIQQNGQNSLTKSYELKEPSTIEKISIDVDHKLAPSFKIIVFYLTNENEIIGDQKSIEVEDLFLTPIDLKSSVNQTQPGEQVDIIVKTSPNAYVGVLGVDQGVILLRTGNDITKTDILNSLQDGEYSHYGRYYGGRSINDFFGSTDVFSSNNLFCIMNGFDVSDVYYSPMYKTADFNGDALRSSTVKFSAETANSVRIDAMPMAAMASISREDYPTSKQKIQVRKDFPETWLFDGKRSDEKDGKAVFSSKIPDTITSWIVSAFAVDKKTGLVVSDEKAKITVFRPFFLKMNLPYSIVRGEIASIQILVFNYMDKDQKVRVSLINDKDQYKFVTSDDKENDIEHDKKVLEEFIDVSANNVSTVTFMIRPKKAGNLILKASAITTDDKAGDKVEKALKVKSEGQTQYRNRALLINLKDNDKYEEKFNIDFPENAIEGSKLININAIGDILGTSMANLGDLVRMPYGCGEQNMVNFVPNIIVLDYLTQSNKLTDRIKQKAIRHLESGYQRQLHYQRIDGSYSAFGEKDKDGSTWLTAFVLKSFVQAKKYIDIDNKVIEKAVSYLITMGSKKNGSFTEKGTVFSKALQGGVSKSTLPLTAYVLIALNTAKNNNVTVDFDLKKTEEYLASQSKSINLIVNDDDPDDPNQYNYYQLAIIAHALHEVNSEMKDEVYEKLWKLAQKADNKLFFDKKEKPKDVKEKRSWHYYIPNSNGVEASSYSLLTAIKRNDTTSAIQILNWLISKQNNNGGFASTQDTVIALEALAAIANKLYVKDTKLDAVFKFEGLNSENLRPKLKVDDSNALELQTYQISETNFEKEFLGLNKVSMDASGKGNAVIQVGWQYNIATPDSGEYFNLTTKALSRTNDDGTKDKSEFSLEICASYKKKGKTNMAVIEVELPSGFIFKVEKIDELKQFRDEIKRIDMKNGDTLAVFYFDKLDENMLCYTVEAERSIKVSKLKPALVKVYDYYKIEESGRSFYLPDQENEKCSKNC